MYVVATAGHVDHGKSTLVTALTGGTPDRLAEEQRRGLSIELGYCWGELPGLAGTGPVAFVDVPGHERFVATMLAGVGPVPATLFVVAADDPWMPQAEEHLAALDGLGVTHGVLAITRSDLADPEPALRRARRAMAGTGLADIPAVAVSARTGLGLDRLLVELATMLAGLPVPDLAAPVRVWVDRSFHVRGAGTVVTGTLSAGRIRVGAQLELAGADGVRVVRVRGLQSYDHDVDAVEATVRVAVNLGGAVVAHRGDTLLTPDSWPVTDLIDVVLTGGRTDELPREPQLHVGANQAEVRVRPLGPTTARLTLTHPLPLRVGDAMLLRDPGSRLSWGVRVLDPAPPALIRRGDAARRSAWLSDPDHDATGVEAHLRRDGIVDLEDLDRRGVDLVAAGSVGARAGRWLVATSLVDTLSGQLLDAVRDHARTQPLERGLPEAAAVRRLALPGPEVLVLLARPPLELVDGRVRERGHEVPAEVRRAVAALTTELGDRPYAAPPAGRLPELGLTPAVIAAGARAGLLLRLDEAVVLLGAAADGAAGILGSLPQPFTTSEARQALDTSRRVVLPLLAHLDRTGRTVRHADDRRAVR